ncbi:MAG TPA: hypothetical protein VF223_19810, partial [Trebonia sp.]
VTSHRVITQGMPVPRDGALLGWVCDRQVTVLLSVYHGNPGSQAGRPRYACSRWGAASRGGGRRSPRAP